MTSIIEEANNKVSIIDACALLGLEVSSVPDGRSSVKYNCPFGDVFHSDGGIEKSFRIYPDDNTAHCFAEKITFRPVDLAAQKWDVSTYEAARRLLANSGGTPKQWGDLIKPRAVDIDKNSLRKALELYARRIAPEIEQNPQAVNILTKLYGLLPKVKSAEDAEVWLTTGKEAVRRISGASDDLS